jgi:hypothetical protein
VVTQTVSPEQARSDAAVMNSLLDLERMAVLAYAAARRHLSGGPERMAARFQAHELVHQRTIEGAIRDLGAHPVPPRPAASYRSGFPPLESAEDALRFALDVENTQISAYGESIASIVTPELRVTALAILGTEAEHMSVVLGRLREPQAPRSLVTGDSPT